MKCIKLMPISSTANIPGNNKKADIGFLSAFRYALNAGRYMQSQTKNH